MRSRRNRPNRPLSELEHLVMDFVWAEGPATAEKVRKALAHARPLKDSTVRTVLRRLEEKKYLTHSVEGRTYRYRAVAGSLRVAANAVRHIIDRFCGGSVEQLLTGMVENEVIEESELRRLTAKVARAKKRDAR